MKCLILIVLSAAIIGILLLGKKSRAANVSALRTALAPRPVVFGTICSAVAGIGGFLQLVANAKVPNTVQYPIVTGGTIVLTAVAAFLFFFKRLRYRSPEELGTEGEKRIAKILSKTSFMGYGSRLLQNLYVPSTARGSSVTSEIDLLYLTPKGLIVIESKNFSGYIFGNDASP